VSSVVSRILVLLAVAFYTLMERKVLGFIILRKGPNKPGLSGWFTPLADAAKLLCKAFSLPRLGSQALVCWSAALLFCVSNLLFWCFYSSASTAYLSSHGVFILALLSTPVFGVMGIGWGSNSKYALLGGNRAVAQTISYEVSFAVLILSLLTGTGLAVWSPTVLGFGLCHLFL